MNINLDLAIREYIVYSSDMKLILFTMNIGEICTLPVSKFVDAIFSIIIIIIIILL